MYPESPEYLYGRMHIVGQPYENPDDSVLPEITESVLRSVIRDHRTNLYYLIEVRFAGKVRLKRIRPDERASGWYYWSIIPPPQ